ncbi:MAG: hypothetical protein KFF73_14675 [Cyclobacteriaceae bacterium]|nr:hypothetical protein [Cyclobacteriaceae bacterium]
MMKNIQIFLIVFLTILFVQAYPGYSQKQQEIELMPLAEFNIQAPVGKLRAIPVQLNSKTRGILLAYSADKEIDPWIEMFYPPTDRMKIAVYSIEGQKIWERELGKGVINGIWFTPVYAFDMDQDGTDEIYYVNNIDSVHILSYEGLRLAAIDGSTGKDLGSWPWKRVEQGSLSHTFRNFIMGGYVHGKPVLITAQGTYASMGIQVWNPGMNQRWELLIGKDEPGPRGSHMSPVIDINSDGVDDLLWGERCIELDRGKYLFIADRDVYSGHSDVIQPTLHWPDNRWYIFTCRETGDQGQIKPRVVMFDEGGNRVWHDLETGHMDMGWTAHTGPEDKTVAFTISRGKKVAGPDGFFRLDVVEYAYEAFSGNPVNLPFSAYNTVPVDLNGDGFHEFASALDEQSDKKIYDHQGRVIGDLGEKAYLAMASKFLDRPGEQILCYYPDGRIVIWGDKNAVDSPRAVKRYQHPYYRQCQRLTGTGYNLVNLGGL